MPKEDISATDLPKILKELEGKALHLAKTVSHGEAVGLDKNYQLEESTLPLWRVLACLGVLSNYKAAIALLLTFDFLHTPVTSEPTLYRIGIYWRPTAEQTSSINAISLSFSGADPSIFISLFQTLNSTLNPPTTLQISEYKREIDSIFKTVEERENFIKFLLTIFRS